MRYMFGILVALGIAGIGSHAFAADAKNYPGSNCVQWSGPDSAVYSFSRIGNFSSTNFIFLDCIAINDVQGKGVSSSWVSVIDRNTVADIRCQLVTAFVNSSGGVIAMSADPVESIGSGPEAQVLDTGAADSNELAHYYLSCRIPPTDGGAVSYISTYQINE